MTFARNYNPEFVTVLQWLSERMCIQLWYSEYQCFSLSSHLLSTFFHLWISAPLFRIAYYQFTNKRSENLEIKYHFFKWCCDERWNQRSERPAWSQHTDLCLIKCTPPLLSAAERLLRTKPQTPLSLNPAPPVPWRHHCWFSFCNLDVKLKITFHLP